MVNEAGPYVPGLLAWNMAAFSLAASATPAAADTAAVAEPAAAPAAAASVATAAVAAGLPPPRSARSGSVWPAGAASITKLVSQGSWPLTARLAESMGAVAAAVAAADPGTPGQGSSQSQHARGPAVAHVLDTEVADGAQLSGAAAPAAAAGAAEMAQPQCTSKSGEDSASAQGQSTGVGAHGESGRAVRAVLVSQAAPGTAASTTKRTFDARTLAALASLSERCMSVKPEERPTFQEVAAALFALSSHFMTLQSG